MFLCVDPGIDTGWALFDGDTLRICGLGLPHPLPFLQFLEVLYIERPQVYPRSKTNPNDLITLAIQVGRIIERVGLPTQTVLPREWKGQVPKGVMCRRITQALTPQERALLPGLPPSKLHNVLDAVGIGLWKKGRL